MATYTCDPSIITNLARQPGGILYDTLMEDNPFKNNWWINRSKMGKFPMHMGLTPTHTIASRFAGEEAIAWKQVLPSNGTGSAADNALAGLPTDTSATNPCCPPLTQLVSGFENKTIQLIESGFASPTLCANDLITAYNPEERLNMQFKQFGQQIDGARTNHHRNEYIRFSTTKLSYTPGSSEFNVASTDTVGDLAYATGNAADLGYLLGINDLPVPTSELDDSLLTLIAQWLDINGVKGYTEQDGAQVYELVTDMLNGSKVITKDDNVRRDFRYADMGKGGDSWLLKGLGTRTIYRNYIHQYDRYPLRFWHDGTKYINIPARYRVATTNGVTEKVNPDWLKAPYQLSEVFNQDVVEISVPDYNANPGGNVQFGPHGYAGQLWFFKDPLNPAQNTGYFYTQMMFGSKPLLQYPGIAIMHLNCNRTKFRNCDDVVTYYQQTYGA